MKNYYPVLIFIFSLICIIGCKKKNYEIEFLAKPWDPNGYFGLNSSNDSPFENNYPLAFNFNKNELYTEFYGICKEDKVPVFNYNVSNDTLYIDYEMKNKIDLFHWTHVEEAQLYKAKIKIELKNKPRKVIARRK